jgi:hypothetical protein
MADYMGRSPVTLLQGVRAPHADHDRTRDVIQAAFETRLVAVANAVES